MMPTIAPRPRILDISEIRLSTSGAICRWLEMAEFKLLQIIPHLNLAVHDDGVW